MAVPLRRPEDVIPHLGERHHWKQGRSAKALADFWWSATSLPPSITGLFAMVPALAGAELLEAWIERETDLGDGQGRPSQTDLLALLGVGGELAVIGIEAKAGEPFGPTVHARLEDSSAGVRARVGQLCGRLGITEKAADGLRYQLLHRTAATLIECERFRASKAVLLVQSLHDDPKTFADFRVFGHAIGFPAIERGALQGPVRFAAVDLWIGWLDTDVPACGLTIAELRQTTLMSPAQWEGALVDGRPFYIRHRWGELSVWIGRKGDTAGRLPDASPWFQGMVGDRMGSAIGLPQVLQATGLSISPDIEKAA